MVVLITCGRICKFRLQTSRGWINDLLGVILNHEHDQDTMIKHKKIKDKEDHVKVLVSVNSDIGFCVLVGFLKLLTGPFMKISSQLLNRPIMKISFQFLTGMIVKFSFQISTGQGIILTRTIIKISSQLLTRMIVKFSFYLFLSLDWTRDHFEQK